MEDGPLLFIGFSLGAGYGAPLVQAAPELYPRAIFIEGAASAWSVAAGKRFAKAGGKKLILACGQAGCLTQVKQLGPALTRAGLDTRVGGSASAGHTYDGSVAQVVGDNWDWLTEGDASSALRLETGRATIAQSPYVSATPAQRAQSALCILGLDQAEFRPARTPKARSRQIITSEVMAQLRAAVKPCVAVIQSITRSARERGS